MLTVTVSVMVTLPVLFVPVGLRSGAPAYILVDRAYAAAYPVDPNKETVLVEQWALTGAAINGLEDNTADTTDASAAATPADGATATPAETAAATPADTPAADSSGRIVIGAGQTVAATYIEGAVPADSAADQYADILTATIVQHDDTDGSPVEILDPSTFLSDDSTFYVQYTDTIIKELPEMDSVTVATINKGKAVTRIGIGDTWAKIRTEDGTEGYVPQNNLSENMIFIAIDRTVWVDTDGLSLRASPSTAGDIIEILPQDTALQCTAISDKWYQVRTSDGKEGYVYVSYTTQDPPPTPTPTPTPVKKRTTSSTSTKTGNTASLPTITGVNGASIVSICESMLGVPYVWAGESRDGVDCSGLVVYAYRQIGIELPHQTNSLRSCGVSVSRADIQPGDIVLYNSYGSEDNIEHTAIYVGGGQVIHAPQTGDVVKYGSLDMHAIVTIRRIIQ